MRSKTGMRAMFGLLFLAGLLSLAGLSAQTPEKAAEVPEVPESAKRIRNPVESTPDSVSNGKQIYSSQCVMCHGLGGNGKGDLGITLKYTIPDLTTREAQQARTDGEWFYILTHGHGDMIGEGERLSEKIRWDLVNYLRSLGPKT